MDKAGIIKDSVSMREAVERCGFAPNNKGFIRCPFHREKTASFKLYKNSFYCFGCGASGDVITLYMKLFDLDFNSALRKLNDDFNLNLYFDRKITLREKRLLDNKSRELEHKRKQEQEDELRRTLNYNSALTELIRLETNLKRYKPNPNDTELHPLFVEACRNIDRHYYMTYLPLTGGEVRQLDR